MQVRERGRKRRIHGQHETDTVLDAYERTLLDFHEKTTLLLALLFDTMELVREGGRVVIPRSTYRYLAYGRKGAEQLLLVKGLELQHNSAAHTDSVIALRPREGCDFTRYHRQAWHQRLPSILDCPLPTRLSRPAPPPAHSESKAGGCR